MASPEHMYPWGIYSVEDPVLSAIIIQIPLIVILIPKNNSIVNKLIMNDNPKAEILYGFSSK